MTQFYCVYVRFGLQRTSIYGVGMDSDEAPTITRLPAYEPEPPTWADWRYLLYGTPNLSSEPESVQNRGGMMNFCEVWRGVYI